MSQAIMIGSPGPGRGIPFKFPGTSPLLTPIGHDDSDMDVTPAGCAIKPRGGPRSSGHSVTVFHLGHGKPDDSKKDDFASFKIRKSSASRVTVMI